MLIYRNFTSLILLTLCVLFSATSIAVYKTNSFCTQNGQKNLDQCAIKTFTGYLTNNTWAAWSSTADLLESKTPGNFGSRYVPEACSKKYPKSKLRVLSQVGKVHDSIFEAGSAATDQYTYNGKGARQNNVGLSRDPVLAANNRFLRYEILINKTAYDWVVKNKLYQASVLESWKGEMQVLV